MTTTGWQGLWSRDYTDLPLGYGSLTVNKYPQRYNLKRMARRYGMRANTALFAGLIGAASGSNVTATHKRIDAVVKTSGPQGGGNRIVEVITDINRNTVAGDVTALKEMMLNVTAPTYVTLNSTINPR